MPWNGVTVTRTRRTGGREYGVEAGLIYGNKIDFWRRILPFLCDETSNYVQKPPKILTLLDKPIICRENLRKGLRTLDKGRLLVEPHIMR